MTQDITPGTEVQFENSTVVVEGYDDAGAVRCRNEFGGIELFDEGELQNALEE